MEQFLAAYIRTTREEIRQNRANVAEGLGFLGRVVHGSNPKIWLRDLLMFAKYSDNVFCSGDVLIAEKRRRGHRRYSRGRH